VRSGSTQSNLSPPARQWSTPPRRIACPVPGNAYTAVGVSSVSHTRWASRPGSHSMRATTASSGCTAATV
jgi:hypothetical protein